MEEILASIRRIISEDDAPEAADPGLPVAPEAEPQPALQAAAFPESTPEPEEADDGVLELTERVDSVGDLDVYAAEPELPAPAPEPAAPLAFQPEPDVAPQVSLGEGLVGAVAASAAATAFGKLTSNVGMGRADQTLEQVVRDLLRPLLKQWLDDNLPGIVQAAVDAEVNRIARGRVG